MKSTGINNFMDYLNKLNKEQLEAALHIEGPLLILAGAGSGKTSTMTHRIAYMMKEKGISPYNILAVTFTNKAAAEMRERVEDLVGEGTSMWILTFHSSCLRILREHCELIGYKKDFVIYDPTDQKTVIKHCIKEKNIDEKQFSPAYVLSAISKAKEQSMDAKKYAKANGTDYKAKTIAELYSAYEYTLKHNNAMDFDDLIMYTVKLFEQHEDVLIKYQNRFKYIMVDEYQDTNYLQYRLIRLLSEAHENLCVVGDDDQCIYQWRGADINNILDFEKDFKKTKVIKLEQNYRSGGNILAAAHSVVEKNSQRKEKKLWTAKEAGEKIKYRRAETEKDEARYIAQEIDLLHGRNFKYKDVAILYRTNAQSRTFEEALLARDVPYRVLGGHRYYDRKEIKDIMSYMRLIQNPDDDIAFERIINEPKRGIGDKTLDKLKALALYKGVSLFEAVATEEVLESIPEKGRISMTRMVEMVRKYNGEKDNLRVSDIYDTVLIASGYVAALEAQNTVEAEGRIENLMEFKSVIYDREKEDINLTLTEFMEKVVLMAEVDNHNASEDAIVLMTMHSSKGLEFPVVFLPGMEDGLFPGWRAFDSPGGIEEERRLCYVGMTRAKERLYLTSAEMRTLYGKTDYTKESQFLRELDKRLVEGDGIWDKKEGIGAGNKGFGNDGFGKSDAFKPFEQLKYVKSQVKQTNSGPKEDFFEGDRINHGKFGEGTIIAADAKTISVMFATVGMKKLAKDIAPIKKIN